MFNYVVDPASYGNLTHLIMIFNDVQFGFGISWVVFNQNLLRLGLFVIGVCPGGVASNFWTLLFNGDVNLSITMTFVSTIAAMGKIFSFFNSTLKIYAQ